MIKRLFTFSIRLFSLMAGFALLAGLVDPRVFWIPSIVSPVLSWILLVLFLLTAWLIYQRRFKTALFPLLILVLAIPSLQKIIAWGEPDVGTSKNEVRLVTANVINLKSVKEDHYPLNEDGIAALINRLDGDVLAFQEYGHTRYKSSYAVIQESGELPYVVQAKKGSMAVFSRYPVRHVSERFFENSVNGYLCVDIEGPGGQIRLFDVHLQSNRVTGLSNELGTQGKLTDRGTWGKVKQMFGRYGRATRTRTSQAETIAALIGESPHPVVVMGDFNDVSTSFPYRFLNTERLRDAWLVAGRGLGATFAGSLPGLRIDYALVDSSFQVKEVEVLDEGDSDHRPVAVEISY